MPTLSPTPVITAFQSPTQLWETAVCSLSATVDLASAHAKAQHFSRIEDIRLRLAQAQKRIAELPPASAEKLETFRAELATSLEKLFAG